MKVLSNGIVTVFPKDAQQKTVELPEDQVESQQVFEEQLPAEEDVYSEQTRNALEHAYVSSGLDYGDRLRIQDPQGNLYDIIAMPNSQIAVQNLALKLEYGQMTNYNTWQEASDAIPDNFSVEKVIVANKSKNPYKK